MKQPDSWTIKILIKPKLKRFAFPIVAGPFFIKEEALEMYSLLEKKLSPYRITLIESFVEKNAEKSTVTRP